MSKLTFRLKVINRCGRIFKNELLQPLELVSREAEIILAIDRQPGRSQDSIAEEMFIDKSGVARCLASMEERGLVLRTVSPTDRRVTLVNLAPPAQTLVPQIRRINQQWSDLLTQSLSPEEAQQLQDTMDHVCQRAREIAGRRKKP